MPETPIKDRIREFASCIRMNDREFQNAANLGDGFMVRQSEPISSAISQIIKAFPQLSPDWLLNGNGSMMRNIREHPSAKSKSDSDDFASTDDQEVMSALSGYQRVAELTPAYHGIKSKDITLPVRVYEEILNQLKKKDQQLEDAAAQIRTLFEMLNSHK